MEMLLLNHGLTLLYLSLLWEKCKGTIEKTKKYFDLTDIPHFFFIDYLLVQVRCKDQEAEDEKQIFKGSRWCWGAEMKTTVIEYGSYCHCYVWWMEI